MCITLTRAICTGRDRVSCFSDGKVQAAVLIGSGYDYAAEVEKVSRPAILKLLNYHYISCSW